MALSHEEEVKKLEPKRCFSLSGRHLIPSENGAMGNNEWERVSLQMAVWFSRNGAIFMSCTCTLSNYIPLYFETDTNFFSYIERSLKTYDPLTDAQCHKFPPKRFIFGKSKNLIFRYGKFHLFQGTLPLSEHL